MNISQKAFVSIVALSATSPLCAFAALPDRATASIYAPKPIVQHVAAPTTGRSSSAPEIVLPHLHASVKSRATGWYWEPREIFHGQFVVYAGWDHDILVNRMEFLSNNEQTFSRQYIMHYDTLSSGFQRTTVECYGQDDTYEGRTEYLSSVVNNKLYLAQVTNYTRYNTKGSQMDVHWSQQGVTAIIGRETINLQACQKDWLPKQFALYQQFGLKL